MAKIGLGTAQLGLPYRNMVYADLMMLALEARRSRGFKRPLILLIDDFWAKIFSRWRSLRRLN